jgi:hypothetical protein
MMFREVKEQAMTSTSARRPGAFRASLLASILAIVAQGWSPELIGDGLAPTDDPDSAYFHSNVMPPSWQGRPYAITNDGGPHS